MFERWIDLDSVRVISHHLSATVAAAIAFWLTGLLIKHVLSEGIVRHILEVIDEVVLLGLFVWFTIQLGYLLWNNRVWKKGAHDGATNRILAV